MATGQSLSRGTASHICEIPFRLPGLNEYIAVCRANRFAGAEFKRKWHRNIFPYLSSLQRAQNVVRIHFTWYEPNHRRDVDNVAFGKKFILDAMVERGILKDDSPKYVCGFTDEFRYGEEKVVIEIEEVHNEEITKRADT